MLHLQQAEVTYSPSAVVWGRRQSWNRGVTHPDSLFRDVTFEQCCRRGGLRGCHWLYPQLPLIREHFSSTIRLPQTHEYYSSTTGGFPPNREH